eukprot:Colp12_sorted_trinity150504_noHs@6481
MVHHLGLSRILVVSLAMVFWANCMVMTNAQHQHTRLTPVTFLKEVADSGDVYPSKLALVSDPKAFEGLKVVFLLGNGVEDHEVYYQHQYFIDRGASTIHFVCVREDESIPTLVISDFFKPSHTLECIASESVDLSFYDVVFIAGGLPSSSAIRENSALMNKVYNFWNSPANAQKLLAVICSGSETLISSGIYADLPKGSPITGSPASFWSWVKYLDTLGLPRDLFKGNDDGVNVQSFVYPSDGKHSHLVSGRNPAASAFFVQNIGKVLRNLAEEMPQDNKPSVPLRVTNGKYSHPQFRPLDGNTLLSSLYPANHKPSFVPESGIKPVLAGHRVGIILGSGPSHQQLFDVLSTLSDQSEVEILCPSWVIPYKNATLFAMTDPPSSVASSIKCNTGLDKARGVTYDVLIVVGGLFSTNGVLRNDGDLQALLKQHQGMTLLFGSAADLLLVVTDFESASVADPIPAISGIKGDLKNAGFRFVKGDAEDVAWVGGSMVVASEQNILHVMSLLE